jgi:hypothetical protein
MVNILRLTVAYLNTTINVKPETQNWRLELTGLAKPRETRRLTSTGPGLARQESAGRVLGRFWTRTDPFLWTKPGPLPGYPDPLLTLPVWLGSSVCWISQLEFQFIGDSAFVMVNSDWRQHSVRFSLRNVNSRH